MTRVYLSLALVLSLVYAAVRSLGEARYVSALSGTLPEGSHDIQSALAHAGLFVLVHFAFVVLVPSLLLAAVFDAALTRWLAKRSA
jgi:hypothetical protein